MPNGLPATSIPPVIGSPVAGLIVSQVLTLFTTPVIYLAFDRLERRIAGRGRGLEGGEAVP